MSDKRLNRGKTTAVKIIVFVNTTAEIPLIFLCQSNFLLIGQIITATIQIETKEGGAICSNLATFSSLALGTAKMPRATKDNFENKRERETGLLGKNVYGI